MFNPYSNKNFFEFFGVLFTRLCQFLRGDLPISSLASDEIQILVLSSIAIASALVGTFLVLRKMTMLANSLSHTILLGIVVAYLLSENAFNLSVLLIAALVTGVTTTFLTQFLSRRLRLQEDASIGLVFNTLFALGIVLVTLFARNVHLGIEAIMGNVDALHVDDVKISFSLLGITVAFILLFFKEFVLFSFDASHAKSLGRSSGFYTYFLMILTSLTSIGAFRAVGVLLFLAFLVGPVLTARLITNRLPLLILYAGLFGTVASLFAVALSRHLLSCHDLPLSTSGLVVTTIASFYFLVIVASKRKNIGRRFSVGKPARG